MASLCFYEWWHGLKHGGMGDDVPRELATGKDDTNEYRLRAVRVKEYSQKLTNQKQGEVVSPNRTVYLIPTLRPQN
jgi:hypothetical protein